MGHQSLVGDYDYIKGGSMETYTQDISLKADHTATYKEYSETKTESFTRSGSGTWSVEGDTVWITAGSLTKDTKTKNKMLGKDEIKTDYNIKIDFKLNELMKAGPSGPDAPKSRWRKKM